MTCARLKGRHPLATVFQGSVAFMDVEQFIARWKTARGGAERANYQMFLTEFCEAFGLPRPDPASDDTRSNDYVFERAVKRRESEGLASTLRIDLYKRGCFILEAKQSRAAHRDDGRQSSLRQTKRPQAPWTPLQFLGHSNLAASESNSGLSRRSTRLFAMPKLPR
jgi:hypothetical protein